MDCTAAGRPENAFRAQQGHCFGPMDCMLSQALRLLLLLALLAQLYLQGHTRVVLVPTEYLQVARELFQLLDKSGRGNQWNPISFF